MSEDECGPLKTLDEVLHWEPCLRPHVTQPISDRVRRADVPKTLICHDMKGGYLEDRFLNGVSEQNCFAFVHWSFVDVFVYFSHNFITIPPCTWINAAHVNGTQILGTLITEWDQGKKICEEFLKDSETVDKLCSQLVNLATCHGFDGWLINIENKIKPWDVKLLETFVRELTKKMHTINPDSLVIWYDSVTDMGELKWQNALNENNKIFFNVCDGIFLNYNWKDEHLKKSLKEAGSRSTDIYVGVDVFGRGCLGGGGFSTNIAVQKAREYGLSVAIFAPGWVHECLEPEKFLENLFKFWDLLSELCFIREIKSLPFSTFFCPGFGTKMFANNRLLKSEPWYNLALQQPQPSYFGNDTSICVDDAFSGGGCLRFSLKRPSDTPCIFRIFSTCFTINESCIIQYSFKLDELVYPHVEFALILNMTVREKSQLVYLAGSNKMDSSYLNNKTAVVMKCIDDVDSTDEDCHGWITRKYFLNIKDYGDNTVKSIFAWIKSIDPSLPQFSVKLGRFEMKPSKDMAPLQCSDRKLEFMNGVCHFTGLLCWTKEKGCSMYDVFFSDSADPCNSRVYYKTTFQEFLSFHLTFDIQPDNITFIVISRDGQGSSSHRESVNVKL